MAMSPYMFKLWSIVWPRDERFHPVLIIFARNYVKLDLLDRNKIFGKIKVKVMSRKDPNKPRGRTTAYAYFVIAEKEAFYRVWISLLPIL